MRKHTFYVRNMVLNCRVKIEGDYTEERVLGLVKKNLGWAPEDCKILEINPPEIKRNIPLKNEFPGTYNLDDEYELVSDGANLVMKRRQK